MTFWTSNKGDILAFLVLYVLFQFLMLGGLFDSFDFEHMHLGSSFLGSFIESVLIFTWAVSFLPFVLLTVILPLPSESIGVWTGLISGLLFITLAGLAWVTMFWGIISFSRWRRRKIEIRERHA
jgi:hypothetical protein